MSPVPDASTSTATEWEKQLENAEPADRSLLDHGTIRPFCPFLLFLPFSSSCRREHLDQDELVHGGNAYPPVPRSSPNTYRNAMKSLSPSLQCSSRSCPFVSMFR